MADNPHGESNRVRAASIHVQIKQLKQLRTRSLLNVVTALKGKLDDFPQLKELFADLPTLPQELQKFQADHPGFTLPPLAQQELRRANNLLEQIEELEQEEIPGTEKKQKKHEQQHLSHSTAPRYMDHDLRYQELLAGNQLVVELRQKYPQLNDISSIAQDPEDGSVHLNRDLIAEFEKLEQAPIDTFAIEEAVREQYRDQLAKENPGLLQYYDYEEKHRKYKSPDADPAVERLKRAVDKRTREEAQRQRDFHAEKARTTYAYSARRVDEDAIRQRILQEEYRQFVRTHRVKAAMYADQSEELREAIKQEELAERRGEAWHVPPGLYGTYDVSSSSPAGTTAASQVPTKEGWRRLMPSRQPPPTNLPPPAGWGRGEDSRNRRPDLRRGKNPVNRLKPPIPTTHQAINLIKNASWFVPPRLYILIAIIVLLLLLLLLSLLGDGFDFGGERNPDGTYPVRITKTGPTAVPNPEEKDLKKPDVSDITYKITVSYAGAADRIVVTDPLDENVNFIKAEGPGNPTYNEDTRTVTWNIQPGSRSNPVSTTPSPTQTSLWKNALAQQVLAQETENAGSGTIHDLGFGPSNGRRIDSMIEKIRPNSPLIGYGDDIVSFAKQFNIDPLMIIITMKESQLCSDNGANVPGGSDPDNFNCGNITWKAAQDGADVSRWNASQGAYVDERYFTFVPTMEDGLGLFFDYIDNPLYQGKTLGQFYDIYNPCSDPVNQEKGYACGAKEAEPMLDLLRQYAGEPCAGNDCVIGTLPEDSNFGSIAPLTLTVRPKSADSWVINQAFAEVIGARKSLPGSSPGRGKPGQPLPSDNVEEIKRVLCDDYNVCPSQVRLDGQTPNSDWNLQQLTALWNVVQRIYESETYKALAIGNYKLEISRGKCYPIRCDNTYGFYAGQSYPEWATIPNARLIVITDFGATENNPTLMEWLFAHEIGHSASGGALDGSLTPELGMNEAYRRVAACGETVSGYGARDTNENNSEILAYYMTAGEEANTDYLGSAKNLKADFPCTYNAVKQYYFDGVEF